MARVRVRQHVNPLSSRYLQPVSLPDWSQIYSNPSLPFYLDLGCARGRFLLQMASKFPDKNFLGIEIRELLVREANRLKSSQNLTNLYYLFANINVSLRDILASLPTNSIQMVMIQFPDPWFKKKHHKRRIVKPEVVDIIAEFLRDDGQVFLQSDVEEVAQEMVDLFLANPRFQPVSPQIWLPENPLGIMTEREIASLNKGRKVYRTLLSVTSRNSGENEGDENIKKISK
ncbi:MAG: tRNA (guanosine(46)-N7)-methyltransferase TrmB [Geminocystis sp.]|nr:tRNA (guanosine(46)-N7)-methyltransferase TrmB [Geminocystis sp.]HIK36453.1 tRNA (guanosine(46)-N7)-methyltransferase TrmB [Geminocystis sp. M7585_C2015_104]MCS7148995.1 tRNA (guanosine(46)-N7)-methyltransferase TrmB [Geminocystis sp.]MCX8077365.1 tRNA (guanosine(46)-N7)-methyltransferase TrmB [Geminocystis sp.]MDW8114812.1 tRNA (guanosine(46)-N7)-methyltransferase TrmB [Geminocystis sp.]